MNDSSSPTDEVARNNKIIIKLPPMARSVNGSINNSMHLRRSSRSSASVHRLSNGTAPSGSEYTTHSDDDDDDDEIDNRRANEDNIVDDDDEADFDGSEYAGRKKRLRGRSTTTATISNSNGRKKSSRRKINTVRDEEDEKVEFADEPPEEVYETRSGRVTRRRIVKESDSEGDTAFAENLNLFQDDEDVEVIPRSSKKGGANDNNINADDDDIDPDAEGVVDMELDEIGLIAALELNNAVTTEGRSTRSRTKKETSIEAAGSPPQQDSINGIQTRRTTRSTAASNNATEAKPQSKNENARALRAQKRREQQRRQSDDQYDPQEDEDISGGHDGEDDSAELEDDVVPEDDEEEEEEISQPETRGGSRNRKERGDGKNNDTNNGDNSRNAAYSLRKRRKVNYTIPQPLGDTELRSISRNDRSFDINKGYIDGGQGSNFGVGSSYNHSLYPNGSAAVNGRYNGKGKGKAGAGGWNTNANGGHFIPNDDSVCIFLSFFSSYILIPLIHI